MGSKRLHVSDLPEGAVIETWGDNTAWIVFDEGRRRLSLREFAERPPANANVCDLLRMAEAERDDYRAALRTVLDLCRSMASATDASNTIGRIHWHLERVLADANPGEHSYAEEDWDGRA